MSNHKLSIRISFVSYQNLTRNAINPSFIFDEFVLTFPDLKVMTTSFYYTELEVFKCFATAFRISSISKGFAKWVIAPKSIAS